MTIAQQLKIKDFPFEIKDKNGKTLYWEKSNGFWFKYEYDAEGNQIYHEDSNGYWRKRECDSNGNQIYWEDSDGYIAGKRPKIVEVSLEITLEEIAKKMGINVKQLRIKD